MRALRLRGNDSFIDAFPDCVFDDVLSCSRSSEGRVRGIFCRTALAKAAARKGMADPTAATDRRREI